MKRKYLKHLSIASLALAWGAFAFINHQRDQKSHFSAYCQERDQVSGDVYRTIHELLKLAGTNDCQAAFQRLDALEEINLTGRKISRLEPLLGLTRTKRLVLIQNEISDLAPIRGMKALEEIYLSQNTVKSLEPLNGMPLRILAASNNSLGDLSSLHDLPQLRLVDIASAQVTKLPDISKMPELKEVYAADNQIHSADLGHLQSKSLTTLVLSKNKLSAVDFVRGLPALTGFSASNNSIKDISPALALPEIIVINARSNQIEKIDSASVKPGKLRKLDLRMNKIKGVPCSDSPETLLCKTVII